MRGVRILRECATAPRRLRRFAEIIDDAAASLRGDGTRTRPGHFDDVDCVAADGSHVILGGDLEDRATLTISTAGDALSIVLATPVLLPSPVRFGTESGRPVDPLPVVLEAMAYAAAGLRAAAAPARRASLDLQGELVRRLEAIGCTLEERPEVDVLAGVRVAAPGPLWSLHAQGMDGTRGAWDVIPVEKAWWKGLPPVLALFVTAPDDERHRPQGAEWERRSWSMELSHVWTDWRGEDDPVTRLRHHAHLAEVSA